MAKKSSAVPPSRRQEHKLRTQRALQQAALELFAKHGYDETTTDEIAEKAGVSPRTFFRYFPTKESVLFAGSFGWYQTFTEHYLAQPSSLSDIDAIRRTLVELADELQKRRKSLVLYERAVASSPTLRGGVQDHVQHDIATLAEAIARRRQSAEPDESCALLAAIVLVTYRRAVMRWLAGPAGTYAGEVVDDELELLVGQFTGSGVAAR